MQPTSLTEAAGGAPTGVVRRRVAAGLLAVSLMFGGVVVANPAAGQPAAAVSVVDAAPSVAAGPVDAAPQFSNGIICEAIDRLAARFSRFPFLAGILNSLRATFGCISPG